MTTYINTIRVFNIWSILWLTNLLRDKVGKTWSVILIPDEGDDEASPSFVAAYLCVVVVRNGSLTACEDMRMSVAKIKKSNI